MNQKFWVIALLALILFAITAAVPGTGELGYYAGAFGSTILCGFLVWMLYRNVKNNPEMLSLNNLSKSLGTMGWLALALIGSITVVVLLLKN